MMTTRITAMLALLASVGLSAQMIVVGGASSRPAPQLVTTHYVATTGNNSNAGTAAAPFLTIDYCVDQATPGDTCVVTAGTYSESVTWATSGSVGNRITLRGEPGAIIVGRVDITGDYVTLRSLTVRLGESLREAVEVDGGDYVEILNNTVTTEATANATSSVGIQGVGNGLVVRGNHVSETCFGMIFSGSNALVTGNTLYHMSLDHAPSCGDIDYIRLFGANNTFSYNTLTGVDMNNKGGAHVDCFQTFDNNGATVTNVLLEGNYCADANQGALFQALSYGLSSGVMIRNNVFTRVFSWCSTMQDIPNVTYWNNTCDISNGTYGLYCRYDLSTCRFHNNIVVGAANNNVAYGVLGGATIADTSHNMVYTSGVTFSGFDANDIVNVDPAFVNSASGNYQLQSTSPAISAGVTLASWASPVDLLQRPRTVPWDIGAYIYQE